jgi:hypothetical protein
MIDLEARIEACERDNARLRTQLRRQNRGWMIGALLLAGSGAIAGSSLKDAVFDSVRAKEVVIVDAKGTVRARLSGDVPDAVMANGHVSKRGTKASGLIIYDEQGIERGGYVTTDSESNAMLTLDSKYHMAALFVAGPEEAPASAMRLYTKDSSIEMRSDDNGSRLSIADKNGVTWQQPAVSLSPATCIDYKKIEQKYPGQRVCQGRFTEAACSACFAQP